MWRPRLLPSYSPSHFLVLRHHPRSSSGGKRPQKFCPLNPSAVIMLTVHRPEFSPVRTLNCQGGWETYFSHAPRGKRGRTAFGNWKTHSSFCPWRLPPQEASLSLSLPPSRLNQVFGLSSHSPAEVSFTAPAGICSALSEPQCWAQCGCSANTCGTDQFKTHCGRKTMSTIY